MNPDQPLKKDDLISYRYSNRRTKYGRVVRLARNKEDLPEGYRVAVKLDENKNITYVLRSRLERYEP